MIYEICADSVAGIRAARDAGARRVELMSQAGERIVIMPGVESRRAMSSGLSLRRAHVKCISPRSTR